MIASGRYALVVAVAGLVVAGLTVWALGVGAAGLGWLQSLHALIAPDGGRESIILHEVRLPRVLAALMVGAALAVAGAVIQAMTGNPLADPGILGVNAGAAFAVVSAIAFFGMERADALVWLAYGGAAAAAGVVLMLGGAGRAGGTPVRLVLAGVVVASFLAALTAAILVLDAQTMDAVRFWTVGSLQGRSFGDVVGLLPHVALPLVLALFLAPQITALSLGSDVAQALGQSQVLWRLLAAALVVALAGAAVALAGPLGFVGLVVPHLARLVVGADYRRILPVAALAGAGLTLLADTLPRALWARDVPVGVTLAMIGGPVFVWLARTRIEARE